MRTSEGTAEIYSALVAANEELTNPPKTEEVQAGQKRYSFAPLPEIIDLVRPILRRHGLALLQEAKTTEGFAGVGTRLVHTSGEWIEFDPLFMPSAADAQSIGSVTTYARRYTLCAALGIAADEDDDAQLGTKTAGAGTREHSPRPKTVPAVAAATVVPAPAPTSGGSGPDRGDAGGSSYGEGERSAPSDLPAEDLHAALVAAYGSAAKVLLRAKKAYGVASFPDLSEDQMRELLAQKEDA